MNKAKKLDDAIKRLAAPLRIVEKRFGGHMITGTVLVELHTHYKEGSAIARVNHNALIFGFGVKPLSATVMMRADLSVVEFWADGTDGGIYKVASAPIEKGIAKTFSIKTWLAK